MASSPRTEKLQECATSSPAIIGQLRADLTHYTIPEVYEKLPQDAQDALEQGIVFPAVRALRQLGSADQVAELARLFMLGDLLDPAEIAAALPNTGLDQAAQIGLIRPGDQDASKWQANFDLRPFSIDLPAVSPSAPAGQTRERTYWFLSDLGEDVTGEPLKPDHVLGIGGATTSLLRLTPREPVESVLDIGTGCGIQAIIAAAHATRVVATDISLRALDMAAFNAALNQVTLDLRAGSMLEPVAGERFNLIISNPPFVITPRPTDAAGQPIMEYRDGGGQDDSIVANLVQDLPQVLADEGVAVMLGNWLLTEDDWAARPRTWLGDCDAWIIQRDSYNPAQYAAMWLRDGGIEPRTQPTEFRQGISDYLDYFAQQQARGVGFGYLAIRATQVRAPQHHFEERVAGNPPSGQDISRFFGVLDWLWETEGAEGDSSVQPLALSERTVRQAADVTEERYHLPGQPDPLIIMLHAGGSGQKVMVNSMFAALFGACDGELNLGQITQALAVLGDVEVTEVLGQVEEPLRQALLSGMLIPI
ncbi:DUF7059 domain-containing protein [Boudabousia marimammalium]|uniref:Uncharacterized protein n=1 Tax=Boudabousia marimammalium TaxID=156892 RepID=A0A1Q5PM96_9ACTO|nr:methyltransferase [Boudabousia marimammalium]OKL48657.1 hypothetical protein BM477_05500 [Boudabousia marimammalium]